MLQNIIGSSYFLDLEEHSTEPLFLIISLLFCPQEGPYVLMCLCWVNQEEEKLIGLVISNDMTSLLQNDRKDAIKEHIYICETQSSANIQERMTKCTSIWELARLEDDLCLCVDY